MKRSDPRPDPAVLALAEEMAARLHDLGLTEAEARVREAVDLACADPVQAGQVLAGVAGQLAALAPERG